MSLVLADAVSAGVRLSADLRGYLSHEVELKDNIVGMEQ